MSRNTLLVWLISLAVVDIVIPIPILAILLVIVVLRRPAWFLGLVVARDLLLLYGTLRIGRRHKKVVVRVRWEGRLSTFLIYVLVFGVLLGAPEEFVWAIVIVATPAIVTVAGRYVLAGRAQLGPPSSRA